MTAMFYGLEQLSEEQLNEMEKLGSKPRNSAPRVQVLNDMTSLVSFHFPGPQCPHLYLGLI